MYENNDTDVGNKIYNIHVIVDYHETKYIETKQDELYKEQLLNVFHEKVFDDKKMATKIEKLYNKLKQIHFFDEMKNELAKMSMGFNHIYYKDENQDDNITKFMYFFSFETFHDIHKLIKQYLFKKEEFIL